jgi:hypothetical protein
MKNIIEEKINFIYQSARQRETEQGILVCKSALEKFSASSTEAATKDILCKFNQDFFGIEAHGHLTQKEFEVIKELKELEKHASNNT